LATIDLIKIKIKALYFMQKMEITHQSIPLFINFLDKILHSICLMWNMLLFLKVMGVKQELEKLWVDEQQLYYFV
jgi:hypothetical protein